jgi:hypothetical protein
MSRPQADMSPRPHFILALPNDPVHLGGIRFEKTVVIYAHCVIMYALSVRTHQHWTACFLACARVYWRQLSPGQRSGGISRSWPNSFTPGHQVCNANLAR